MLAVAATVGIVLVGVTSCGSSTNTSTSSPASSSSTATPTPTATDLTTTPATPAPTAPGLPPYTPPPPDAEGNPPCEFGVGWNTFYDGDTGLDGTYVLIQKTAIPPNQYINLPDYITVVVRTTDGRHLTQDAFVGNGATDKWDSVAEKDFIFRTVDPHDVKEVVMTTSKGQCWVQGNP